MPVAGIVAVGHDCVGAFAEHYRIGALRISGPQILAGEPATKMEGHPGHAFADAFGDQRFHLRLGAVLSSRDPDPAAILDSALGRVRRTDLDEHVLLQLGEPPVGAGLLAAAFVFHKATRRNDQRERLGNASVDSSSSVPRSRYSAA